ncbi:MAG TPA: hypothetical protein VJ124_21135 [Pyrinomonadaceae bacterium]|nr:hypothetical protein [Pyrinomonadaceae bacterium]
MSTWQRFHLNESVKALTISDNQRFFIRIREPHGENRHPLEFYRWNLREAQEAADRVVQAYYPHECDNETCGVWRKIDG